MIEHPTILLVEDNEDDVFLMQRALRKAHIQNPLQIVRDGQQAIDYLAGDKNYSNRLEYPRPQFIFLDLKLPYVSGWTVLKWIRTSLTSEYPRVFILTSSNEPMDLERTRELGADAYLVKPPTAEMLLNLERTFDFCWVTPVDVKGSGV